MIEMPETIVDLSETLRESEEHNPCHHLPIEKYQETRDTENEARHEQKGHHKKTVSFTSLDIRSYSVTVGDHPLCSEGYPLTLDWEYTEASPLSIDQYEAERSPRRSLSDLRTTSEERHQILAKDHGLSQTELRHAQRKIHRARSCSAKLCEKMNESFFQDQVEANAV